MHGKAGTAVAAIPAGQDAQGQPFGVTVFAEPGRDALVLNAAAAIESVVGRRMVPHPAYCDETHSLVSASILSSWTRS